MYKWCGYTQKSFNFLRTTECISIIIIIIIIIIIPILLYILSTIINDINSKNKKYVEDKRPLECAFHPKINSSRMTTVITIFPYEIKQISHSDTCHAYYGRTVTKQAAIRVIEQP